jgi:hypothetical protein
VVFLWESARGQLQGVILNFHGSALERSESQIQLMKSTAATLLLNLVFAVSLHAQDKVDPLAPYAGTSVKGVDASTLKGKVMTGYQGWFNCPGDGAGLGWTHWARQGSKLLAPGNVTVDLWPDMSEATEAERFTTGFKLANGEPAVVFSSCNRTTVPRHFKWLRE